MHTAVVDGVCVGGGCEGWYWVLLLMPLSPFRTDTGLASYPTPAVKISKPNPYIDGHEWPMHLMNE